MIERYRHHGEDVAVISAVKGKHREHCLCMSGCPKFPEGGTPEEIASFAQERLRALANEITSLDSRVCPQAAINYALCREFDMATPVYECKDCPLGVGCGEPAQHK